MVCKSKLSKIRSLIRMATKRPMEILKELHAFIAKTGHCVHVIAISQALHKFGLYSRVARRKPLLKKGHPPSVRLQSRFVV